MLQITGCVLKCTAVIVVYNLKCTQQMNIRTLVAFKLISEKFRLPNLVVLCTNLDGYRFCFASLPSVII